MQQQMTCPKCMGVMRQFERNGVIVDQCAECRGIFLDRGELEKLVDAENSFYDRQPQAQAQPPQAQQHQPQYQQQYQQPRYEERRYDSHGHGDSRQHKKKHSFFEELFD